MTITLCMAALATLVASAAFAGTPGIDRREARQHARITRGVASDRLTRHEARRLRAGQHHVRRMERRARMDGQVTMRERGRISRAQDRQSRAIWRLNHNRRIRA